ncbi:MAG: hypothetical protein RMM17_08910 [Acidobacteriota bacterium]|nr:hypothetical protein [Blastocatellia bacterium]MDW8412786.1 hypothetical protein [Acidobacteriota bacterium]
MKLAGVGLAIFGIAIVISAQEVSIYHEVSEVEIKNISSLGLMGGMVSISTGGMGSTSGSQSNTWRLEFRLKNTSDKVITRVGWQFKMPNSPRPQDIRQFRTKCKVKPQKDAVVGETVVIDPSLVPERPVILLNVTRLEFEDGTYWEQPAPKPEEK